MQENQWKELDPVGIKHFKKIQHGINTFYKERRDRQKIEYSDFKVKLVTEENIRILISKVGNISKEYDSYTFLVYAQITLAENVSEYENWIHIDGIQEERNILKEKGVLDHPVFDIICMSDIYDENSFPVSEDKIPKIKDLT